MSKSYGYLKTNVDVKEVLKQIEDLKAFGVAEDDLYSDGASRQTAGFEDLLAKLEPGDTLVLCNASSLGATFDEIIASWSRLTAEIGADIVILDMPLMDTREQNLDAGDKTVSEIVLEIMSYFAKSQRNAARQRQAEDIAEAKSRGVHFGQKQIARPSNYEQVRADYLAHKINRAEASKLTGVSKSTFDRWIKEDRAAEA